MGSESSREGLMRVLREAAKVVEEADVPDDLRSTAFERAFDALLPNERPPNSADSGTTLRDKPAERDVPSLEAIGARLGVDAVLLSDVYHMDGENLGIGVAPSRFDSRKAAGTKQIALLLAAGRQAGGWEEWTPVRFIREVTRDFGRFDSSNFATTIKEMGDVFNIRGRAQQVEVRVTRPGYERAGQLIRDLASV